MNDYDAALQAPDQAQVSGRSTRYPWFRFAIFFNRGNMRAASDDYLNAVEDYRRAAEVNPRFAPAHFNSGNAHFMQQRFADAVACYDQVLSVAPRDTSALINKALALILLGKLDAAETCCRSAQSDLPNNTLAPLSELKTILAGLPESRLSVEVASSGKPNEATVNHPDYHGGRRAVLFKGITGSAGNVGGAQLKGGEGFKGGAGILVWVEES